jgi:hypothetical protein
MISRSLSTRAAPLAERQRNSHRRRWSALPAWVRREWHRSLVMRDRAQASRDRHIRSYLGGRWGPRL